MDELTRLIEIAESLRVEMEHVLERILPGGWRCERVYDVTVTPDELGAWLSAAKTFTVYIVIDGEDDELLTRDEDEVTYRLRVLFIEKYHAAGQPPTSWMDELLMRARQIIDAFGEYRDPLMNGNDGPRAKVATPVMLYDMRALSIHQLFWAEYDFEFVEVTES